MSRHNKSIEYKMAERVEFIDFDANGNDCPYRKNVNCKYKDTIFTATLDYHARQSYSRQAVDAYVKQYGLDKDLSYEHVDANHNRRLPDNLPDIETVNDSVEISR